MTRTGPPVRLLDRPRRPRAGVAHELDVAACSRDTAADARDVAAELRDDVSTPRGQHAPKTPAQAAAASDRAEAASDRAFAAEDRVRAQRQRELVYRDELTGTLQRQAGHEQLVASLQRAQRVGDDLVVAFVDVDHLKRRNDAAGHREGDRLLRDVGTALLSGLRSYDVVVRYGGDEFVCAMPGATLEVAQARFEGVGAALAALDPTATISSGLAHAGADDGIDDLIRRADMAMYARRRTARRRTAADAGRAS